jgi:hypothetical protein
MPTIKYVRESMTKIDSGTVSFDMRDQKNREIGYVFRTYVCRFRAMREDELTSFYDINSPFWIVSSATRDGKEFGACTSEITGDSLDDVMRKLNTRIENCRKRYLKKFAS